MLGYNRTLQPFHRSPRTIIRLLIYIVSSVRLLILGASPFMCLMFSFFGNVQGYWNQICSFTSSPAALYWLWKDGLGQLSRCIYTAILASAFNTNLKRVRFSTSVVLSLSFGVELMTPPFPKYFLLLASIANIAKQISLACYLATGTVVHQNFAVPDNLGEVSTKAEVQTVCFDNLGLMLAAALNRQDEIRDIKMVSIN